MVSVAAAGFERNRIEAREQAQRSHHAQLLTYLKVSHAQLGLLINVNVPRLIEGVMRFRIQPWLSHAGEGGVPATRR
jgi:hypothetical protein